ncbi:hypothetical protein HMF7854_08615 [Sphingomonas ginkgonis]|uniref:DUF1049 domain-containing protein n=1 Tax=Sphingomonas ginkgonis TaxID=2315330 RepID=A0A429VAD8_9SPHN|nr:hypothetical protein [Sphingomonas ginkgonis]RST30895.1 hypothetical protein HMF7854_08615 [Sphingomonas ginkgonis]
MRFLKTLFWVLLAVCLTIFAMRNWHDVAIALWGNLEADIKLPVLLLLVFLLGLLPTWLVQRARIWTLARRLDSSERNRLATPAAEPLPVEEPAP